MLAGEKTCARLRSHGSMGGWPIGATGMRKHGKRFCLAETTLDRNARGGKRKAPAAERVSQICTEGSHFCGVKVRLEFPNAKRRLDSVSQVQPAVPACPRYTNFTMSEDKPPETEIGESSQVGTQIETSKPVGALGTKPATEQQLNRVETDVNAFESSTLRWTKATFFVFAVTLVFIALQWVAIRGQLHEMRSGSADTHALAVAANTQATKMANVSDAADKIRQAAQDMVIQDQRIVDNAQSSFNATVKEAELSERAWVGVTDVQTPTELHEGTLLNSTISLVNSGKTPSLNVIQRAGYRIVKAEDRFDPAHEVSLTAPMRQGTILSEGKRMLSICNLGNIGRQRAIELNSGEYRLYMFGEITYEDVFNHTHHTRFCMRMELGKALAFSPYGSYDYAD
jgi:hypothetical protein